MKIALIEQNVIDEMRENQLLILSHLKSSKKYQNSDEKYIITPPINYVNF